MPPIEHPNGDRATARKGIFEPGTIVDLRYRIEAVIGRGGMGEVYRAIDLDLGRAVALKVLNPRRAASELALQRLRREARHMALLQHPNNVRLYEFAEVSDGLAYLAMEYVEGRPLSELGFPLAPRRAVQLAADVCAALAEAHGRGLVHRDLKPQNVMVARVDDKEFARVLDYGVATLLAAPSDLTRDGTFVGTALYASPEQAEGARVGPAVDIYALGAMLFEMLSGQRIYDGPTEASVLYQHAHAPTPRLERAVPDCDPALARLVANCLEKAPERRPATATEVRKALLELADRLSTTPPAEIVQLREVQWHSDSSMSQERPVSPYVPATPSASTEAATVGQPIFAALARPRRIRQAAALALVVLALITAGWVWGRGDHAAATLPSATSMTSAHELPASLRTADDPAGAADRGVQGPHWWSRQLADLLGERVAMSVVDRALAEPVTRSARVTPSVVVPAERPRPEDQGRRSIVPPADEVVGAAPSRSRLEGELRTLVDSLPDEAPATQTGSDRVRVELDLLGPIE